MTRLRCAPECLGVERMEPWMDEVGNNGGAGGVRDGESSLAAAGVRSTPPPSPPRPQPTPPPHDPPEVPLPPSRMDAEGEPREGEIGIEQQNTNRRRDGQTDRRNRPGSAATASPAAPAQQPP